MSLTKVPLNTITAEKIGTTANTTSGANVVFLANVAPTSDLVSNQVGLLKGNFVDFVASPIQPQVQGTTSGYTSGGLNPANSDVIDKFPFASDSNATDVGNLSLARQRIAGASSASHGYSSGGYVAPTYRNTIDKFPFAANNNAGDIADLHTAVRGQAGQNSTSDGYVTGGQDQPLYIDNMQKFSLSSDENATDIGELTDARRIGTGNSSTTHGYHAGGLGAGGVPSYHHIDKFPFSTDQSSTDIAELSASVYNMASNGANSDSHGYVAGGYDNNPSGGVGPVNIIQKYSHSTDTNGTDVGDLTSPIFGGTGQSSTSDGYQSGGQAPSMSNRIDKFPFSSDTNATDIADLTQARTGQAGQQV